MTYSNTWFGKQTFTMKGGRVFEGRIYWIHSCVEVFTGNLVPMNHKNPDGSISVLGAENLFITKEFSFGSHDKKRMQKDLEEHAEKLKEAGAKIIKKTKNILVARHGNETALWEITPIKASTYFDSFK